MLILTVRDHVPRERPPRPGNRSIVRRALICRRASARHRLSKGARVESGES